MDIIDSPSLFRLCVCLYTLLWVRIYSHFISLHFAIGEDICSRSYTIRFRCQSELYDCLFSNFEGGSTFQGGKTHRRTANADFEMSFFLVLVVGVSCLGGGLPDVHGSCCDHFPFYGQLRSPERLDTGLHIGRRSPAFTARVTRLHLARVERPGPPGPGSRLEGEVFDVGRWSGNVPNVPGDYWHLSSPE